MHPKVKRFLELTKEHKEDLKTLYELSLLEAEMEHDMVLNYLEFSDDSNNYGELLALEIDNEIRARELSDLVVRIELLKNKIESVKQAIQNLIYEHGKF
jgi:hypothetical protein